MFNNQAGLGFLPSAVFSIISDLGLVALVFYFIWRNAEPLNHLGWTTGRLPMEALLGLLFFVPVMFTANYLESALHHAGLSMPTRRPAFLMASGNSGIALAVALVIVVAVVEETIFRGYLLLRLKPLLRWPWVAVLLSSAVFAVGHGYEGLAGVISVFGLGVVLAAIYLWRRSLVAPMVIHFCIDFSAIVLAALVT